MKKCFNNVQMFKSSEDCYKYSKSVSYETLVIGATTTGTDIKQIRRLFLSSADKPLTAVGTLTSLLRNSAKVVESLLQTLPVLKLVKIFSLMAVLSIGIISESWAITCPSGTHGSDDATDTGNYCGVNCCWGIDSNNVLTITPALDSDNKPYTNVVMKDFNGTTDYSSGKGYTSDHSSNAPWARQGATSVVVENGISNIGNNAFRGDTKITSVSGMESVTTVGSAAFWLAKSIQSIDMPKVTTVGSSAFCNMTSLESVNMPNLETIGSYGFAHNSSLTSVNMPNVTKIDGYGFQNATSLHNVDLSSVTSLDGSVFDNSGLLNVIISDDTNTNAWSVGAFGSSKYNGHLSTITCWGDEKTCYKKLGRYFTYSNCPSNIPSSYCTCSRDNNNYGYCISPSRVQFPTAAQCSASKNYYYDTSVNNGNGGCRKLPTTQSTCNSSGNIWNSTDNKCEKLVCPSNCLSCNASVGCTTCNTGYLINSDGGCTTPDNCKDGWHIDGSNCVANTDANCNTEVDGQCTECKTDYLINSDGGCTTPENCNNGWHIDGDICMANSDANCNTEVDGQCTECKADYLTNPDGGCTATEACTGEYIVDSVNNACKKIPGCINFADGACGGCESGYYKKDGGCVSAAEGCGGDYLEKDGVCISATQGCGESYKNMGGFCNRIRYTPAEAAQVLKNDNTNEVTITFKK